MSLKKLDAFKEVITTIKQSSGSINVAAFSPMSGPEYSHETKIEVAA